MLFPKIVTFMIFCTIQKENLLLSTFLSFISSFSRYRFDFLSDDTWEVLPLTGRLEAFLYLDYFRLGF